MKVRVHIFIGCVAILCCMSFMGSLRRAQTDLPLENVCLVEGTLIYDSSTSRNGNRILRIRLSECENTFGNRSSAKGVITLIDKDNSLLSCGTKICAEGKLNGELFICNDVIVCEKHKIQIIRERLIKRVQKKFETDYGSEGSKLAMALLLGRTDNGEIEIREKARQCGCLHILALSGMHLNIIAGVSFFIFGKKKPGRIIALICVSAFIFISGPRPSLVRAYLMFLFSFMGTGEALIISFLIQSLIMPFQVSDLGFIYGYLATFGLVFIGPYLRDLLSTIGPDLISRFVSTTASALLLTCPIQILTEGKWHLCCFIVAPVAGLIAKLSMITGLMILFVGNLNILNTVLDKLYCVMDSMFTIFADFPEGGWALYFAISGALIALGVFYKVYRRSSPFLSRVI